MSGFLSTLAGALGMFGARSARANTPQPNYSTPEHTYTPDPATDALLAKNSSMLSGGNETLGNAAGAPLPPPQQPYGQAYSAPQQTTRADGLQGMARSFRPGEAVSAPTPGYKGGVKVDASGQPELNYNNIGSTPRRGLGALMAEHNRNYDNPTMTTGVRG